jgi:hypothetical protein
LAKRRAQAGTTTNANKTTHKNELKTYNNTSVTFLEDEEVSKEDNKQESSKMWQSVVTCAPVRVKPISKRSQHAIEDLQALQQEQSLQDPTGYNRQVLPNIRPVPKSKFVYKGLAYKESKKLPGITNENDGNALQKPLIAYNLAQAYARYEINAARVKQNFREPPPTAATTAITKDQQISPLQTSLDLREMRKRIVRGTTLAYRPPPQSISWTPGRGEPRSSLGSEVLLPMISSSTVSYSPSSLVFSSQQQQHITIHTTPNLSQNFELAPTNMSINISSL